MNAEKLIADDSDVFLDLHSETEADLDFDRRINEVLIGQPKAKLMLRRINRAYRSKLRDTSRPIFKSMLVGKSHVGKTETARALAFIYHGNPDAFVKINCETFLTQSDMTRLAGTGPGWAGYDDPRKNDGTSNTYNTGALLSRANLDLSKRGSTEPVVIILFDEIEKAKCDEFAPFLLKMLDTGKIVLGNNVEVDLSDCIILMTSNEGMRDFEEASNKTQMGFNPSNLSQNKANEELADHVDAALKRRYAPEFLNRLDEIVIYFALTKEELTLVVGLEVKRLEQRIANSLGNATFKLTVEDEARTLLRDKAFSLKGDSAELKRVFPRHMSDPLGEGVNRGLIMPGDHIVVSVSRANLEQLEFKRVRNGTPMQSTLPVSATAASAPVMPVVAQHIVDAMKLQEKSVEARNNKQFKEAEALINEGLELLDLKSPVDACAATSLLNQKGHVYFDQKDYKKASLCYVDAVNLRNQHLSPNNWLHTPGFPYLVGNAAAALVNLGRKDEAKSLLKSGLEWVEIMYVGTSDVEAVEYLFDRYMQTAPDMQSELIKKAVRLTAKQNKG